MLNPVLDAALDLAGRPGFNPAAVAEVTLRGHPLLRQRTDRPDVATGRESQVSAQHAIAIAFRRGKAGLDEFDDAAVAETLAQGRPQVTFVDDDAMHIAEARMQVRMADGEAHEIAIAAARGSPENNLTDAEIEEKLAMLAARAGFDRPIQPLIDAVWRLDEQDDAGAVSRLAGAGAG